ncbi:hypothetical protein AP058_02667 [Flavobacterium sp. TAB 87]|nr:hypothetical protein AP058_02667 [Flavobacterium sp. TAB 87]
MQKKSVKKFVKEDYLQGFRKIFDKNEIFLTFHTIKKQ